MAELFGDFLLNRLLARGAWSELWLGMPKDRSDADPVVVKRLLPAMARRKDAIAMLKGEGQLACQFDHPNVVTSSPPLCTADGHWHLVQPYIRGTNLGKLLAYSRRVKFRMPLHLRVFIAAAAAQGLSHAHGRRDSESGEPLHIVHRDITPANLLVSLDGIVRVTDFGIARGRGRKRLTAVGQVRGTLAYMAPEQAAGGEIDARADLYALGVVFWELLSGQRMYPEAPDFALLARIANDTPPPPSSLDDNVDSDLDAYVHRCLQKRPEDRFQSAAALCVLLYQWLDTDQTLLSAELSAWLGELSKASRSGAHRLSRV
ncbi:MAG: serine/threonine protein kinase [Myxococcales bacterium]|nr:serine/threonine protein kinase [Myxococcales bacterium]